VLRLGAGAGDQVEPGGVLGAAHGDVAGFLEHGFPDAEDERRTGGHALALVDGDRVPVVDPPSGHVAGRKRHICAGLVDDQDRAGRETAVLVMFEVAEEPGEGARLGDPPTIGQLATAPWSGCRQNFPRDLCRSAPANVM